MARMRPCPAREMVVHVLREAGRLFKSNSMMSWRPHLLLALGLLSESIDDLRAMDFAGVHRTWPATRAFAIKLEERPAPAPAQEEPSDAEDAVEFIDDSSSSSSSSDYGDSGCEPPAATTASSSTSGSTSAAPAGSSVAADDARVSKVQG